MYFSRILLFSVILIAFITTVLTSGVINPGNSDHSHNGQNYPMANPNFDRTSAHTRLNGADNAETGDVVDDMVTINKCVICLDKTSELMLFPCAHICVCQECWDNYYAIHVAKQPYESINNINIRCPICNQKVNDAVQIIV